MLPYPPFGGSHLSALVGLILLGIGLVSVAIAILPYGVIFKKAGFSPWIALLMIVPLVNLIALYVIAFSRWKVAPARYSFSPAEPPPTGQS